MGRMKEFYLDHLTDDASNDFDELINNYIGDVKLPSEKELKRVAKVVRTVNPDDYEELTGRTLPTVESKSSK